MKVKKGSESFEKFRLQVGALPGSVLLPLLFVIVLGVISECSREDLMNKILYADDLVLVSERLENLRKTILK